VYCTVRKWGEKEQMGDEGYILITTLLKLLSKCQSVAEVE
jgi:hypothetical protein